MGRLTGMALQVRGVHHITLTVSDVARSTQFYEKILGVTAFPGDNQQRCMSCGNFLLALQLPSKYGRPNDRFDENRLGLDHLALAVESRAQLETLITTLAELGARTAGIEFDPDGQGEYVCFRDPDNIQVEFYVGDYEG